MGDRAHRRRVVADAPAGRERIQVFTPAGFRIHGFVLPIRRTPRVLLENYVMNGIGSLLYTGRSIVLSQPDTGSLVTEHSLDGAVVGTFGHLRQTGHEDDRQVDLALNSGIPLVAHDGGWWVVFQTGEPLLQKYDRQGQLIFERHVQGREIDDILARMPTTWPRRRTEEGEVSVVSPTLRTGAVDRDGDVWIAFVAPLTYVYDRDGDKIRTVQFRAAGLVAPNSLFFASNGRVLVTPGLSEFAAK